MAFSLRDPSELPNVMVETPSWDLVRLGPISLGSLSLGPLVIDRASALLGLRTPCLVMFLGVMGMYMGTMMFGPLTFSKDAATR